MIIRGSWKCDAELRRFTARNPGRRVPPELEAMIVDNEKNSFFGWILAAINNIGHNGKRQLFYLAFTARFHGLSNSGQYILASHGFMMKITMYNTMRDELLAQYKEKTRSEKCSCPRVNFENT